MTGGKQLRGLCWLWVLCGSATALVGCKKREDKEVCPRASASFLFEIQAEGGALPPDLSVAVGFGGSSRDSYSLRDGNSSAAELCCRPFSAPIPPEQALPSNLCGTEPAKRKSDKGGSSPVTETHDAAADGGTAAKGGFPPQRVVDAGRVETGPSIEDDKQEQDAGTRPSRKLHVLVCELWSNGAAELRIEGGAFPPLEQTLETERSDDPGLERCPTYITKRSRFMLRHGDAGVIEP